MNKILATDLDGTLFYPKQKKKFLPKNNLLFVQKWIDNGNRLALVTSRSEEFLQNVVKEINRPVDLVICNSSKIISDNKVIRDVTVANDQMRSILTEIDKRYHPTAYLMTTEKYPCVISRHRFTGKLLMKFYKMWWKRQGMYREPFILSNATFQKELAEGKIYKVMVFFGLGRGKTKFTKDLNKIFHKEFPDVEFSWVGKVIEVTPKDCSKGKGLEYYCKYLNAEPNDIYVIGDSGNDISMFNSFRENSYCMKHSSKVVKKYAAHIVPRVASLEKLLEKETENHESN